MKKTLVIFDFDGVIVDSLGFLFQTYLDFLAQFDVEGSEEEFDMLNGPKLTQIITYLKNKYQLQPTEKELFDDYLARMSKLYDEVGLFEGIEDSLIWLRNADCKIALASSCGRAEIDKVFGRFDLAQYFDFIATGDDVKQAKPEPDIYLLAKSQFADYQALVLEDSENGVQAAMAAGLPTVMFNPRNTSIATKTDHEIQSHAQLRSIVAELGLSCVTIAQAQDIILELVDQGPEFTKDQVEIIDSVWNEELKRKQLFNGEIISYLSHDMVDGKLHMKCFLAEYKQFLAQLKSADLDLHIAPIGVSGIIIDSDNNTLLGVRNNVTEYSGFLEFVPAGSIDPKKAEGNKVPFQEQLIEEFEEETNMSRNDIDSIEPFCLVFDEAHRVYDICSKIRVNQPLKTLLRTQQNDEYLNIRILPLATIMEEVTQENCIPTSLRMLENLTFP